MSENIQSTNTKALVKLFALFWRREKPKLSELLFPRHSVTMGEQHEGILHNEKMQQVVFLKEISFLSIAFVFCENVEHINSLWRELKCVQQQQEKKSSEKKWTLPKTWTHSRRSLNVCWGTRNFLFYSRLNIKNFFPIWRSTFNHLAMFLSRFITCGYRTKFYSDSFAVITKFQIKTRISKATASKVSGWRVKWDCDFFWNSISGTVVDLFFVKEW